MRGWCPGGCPYKSRERRGPGLLSVAGMRNHAGKFAAGVYAPIRQAPRDEDVPVEKPFPAGKMAPGSPREGDDRPGMGDCREKQACGPFFLNNLPPGLAIISIVTAGIFRYNIKTQKSVHSVRVIAATRPFGPL